ncbi:DUF551 domain-containing protein [Enterobacter kobei]|uniref:DUF551 domain-containing protein n=2 Tax=Enterobacter kobei TaxID=208224 RepID=UPI002A74B957|nr:DUF551 domain-containing protein [Enterobacter kobei]MDY3578609.1 DUF551 domain-containing protein [Enterobacter kobei]
MSTIAKEFTKEQLIEKLQHRIAVAAKYPDLEEAQLEAAIFKIALASLESEAVAWLLSGGGAKNNVSFDSGNAYADPLREVTPLYTAPPAPVSVPAEVGWEDVPEDITEDDMEVALAWAHGFNQCRAAMLQGVENAETPTTMHTAPALDSSPKIAELPSGNSPVIPDGWVACSDKNPEKGRWLALFGKRTKENCDPYVDEGYLGSDGEFYFFDWESGPRIDDCHPYDKAIVSHWMYWELPAAPQQEVNNGD